MRFLSVIGTFLLISVLSTSCQKNTNSNPVPVISFKSFTGTGVNQGTLAINFSDGDGDIGYPSQDPSAQPNLWVKYLYYDTGSKAFIGVPHSPADTITHDSVYYVYNVPYITPAGKDKSLSGIIEVAINTWYANPYNDLSLLKVEFQIYMFDRAGHKSNVITTPVLYPGTPATP
jgi:hypothetical protein